MRYIGVDLGTSAVKLLLMEEDGTLVKSVSREYPLHMPRPGWSEQDPADWERESLLGIRQLLEGEDPGSVRGIGVGGQMHGLVALDEAGRVLRPAILWNDGRTEEESAWLNRDFGVKKLAELTGNISFAGFTAPKLLWMRKHEPKLFERIHRVMLPKDYLVWRLTGVHSADCSDASGMLLFDVEHRRWSREMLELCSLREEQMGRVYESSEIVGCLTGEAAERTGLSREVRVAAGAGDNAAAAVGTGTVGSGLCNISVGTSGTIFLAGDQFVNPENHAIHSFCHADGGWHLMGCQLSAAACNQWWSGVLGTDDYTGEQAGITGEKLGRDPVFWLPYLMGERTPHNDAQARGAFLGMSMDTDRSDMTQAVLEGVAFGLKDGLLAMGEPGRLLRRSRICGGGAKSPVWRRILANVLDLQLDRLAAEEGPALGGAMLAAVGCGAYSGVEEAAKQIVRTVGTVEPEPELVSRYAERYSVWKELYPRLKELFPRMAAEN